MRADVIRLGAIGLLCLAGLDASALADTTVTDTMIASSVPVARVVRNARASQGTIFSSAIDMPTSANGDGKVVLFVPQGATGFSALVSYKFLNMTCNKSAADGQRHWQDLSATYDGQEDPPAPVTLHVQDEPGPLNIRFPKGTRTITLSSQGEHWCADLLWGNARFVEE